MAQVAQTVRNFPSEESIKRALEFKCRPDDFLICTSPKSGTTLMQQIVQSLRTGGDMSFEEISFVIPFIELGYDYGLEDLDAPQPGCIRGFKTHKSMDFCARVEGTKCIYICRNPLHVATSFFHFFEGWVFDEGSIQVDEFVEFFFMERGRPERQGDPCSIWHHFLSAFPHRAQPDCLFLFYEDLVQHKQECVRLVASFLGIEATPELLKTVLAQSEQAAMAATPSKYDDHPVKLRRNSFMGRPTRAGVCDASTGIARAKVRMLGQAKAQISERVQTALLDRWEKLMLPETGCKTYEEFRSKVNSELRRPWLPK